METVPETHRCLINERYLRGRMCGVEEGNVLASKYRGSARFLGTRAKGIVAFPGIGGPCL